VAVIAPDGSRAVIRPGPRGVGIQVAVVPARSSPGGRIASIGKDLTAVRGRRPSKPTIMLRMALVRDKRARYVRPARHYERLLERAGVSPSAARQTVRREVLRIVGRPAAPGGKPGRPPSPAATWLRATLGSIERPMPDRQRAAIRQELVRQGLTRKAATSLLARELARASRTRKGVANSKQDREAQIELLRR
jgi:hypothetical protein